MSVYPCYQAIGHEADCDCAHCAHDEREARTCDHLRIQDLEPGGTAMRDDRFGALRGIAWGLIFSLALWVVMGAIVWSLMP